MCSKEDFLSWDTDLDLVELLGEYTDDEDRADKQIQKEVEGYQCPDCNKVLKSISGFQGHMLKQHQKSKTNGVYKWSFLYVQQILITLKVLFLIYKPEVDIEYYLPYLILETKKMFPHIIFVLFTCILLQQVTIEQTARPRTTVSQVLNRQWTLRKSFLKPVPAHWRRCPKTQCTSCLGTAV